MLLYVFGVMITFVLNTVTRKLWCYSANKGIKLIMWKADWHEENQNLISKIADWVLL